MRVRRLILLVTAIAIGSAAVPTRPGVAADAVIGAIEFDTARAGDSLLQIARRHDLGFVELMAANPGVDPWLPGEGTRLVLPKAHVLPDAPHRGIVINLAEQRLYYFDAQAVVSYPVGTGRAGCETPLGDTHVAGKREAPSWTPPASIRAEKPELPAIVPAGPDNPLGAFALDLGWPEYVIHGTNKPLGIGRRVSHGCIRLYPEDIAPLFESVRIGTPVTIVDQPLKLGWLDGELYLEAHPTQAQADELEATGRVTFEPAPDLEFRVLSQVGRAAGLIDWAAVDRAARERRGVPVRITR
jgi:L,D-transpeptidase ErfK/SrfK